MSETVAAIQVKLPDGSVREVSAGTTPLEIAEQTNLLGTEATVLDRLRIYRDLGIHTLRVGLRGDNNRDRLTQLERLMALVAQVNAEPVS